jgi:PAS domain S-box-containing protein
MSFPELPNPTPHVESYGFRQDTLVLTHPMVLDKSRIGYVVIQSDLKALHARLRRYAVITACVMALSIIVAALISFEVGRKISRQRERIEAALQESEERLRLMVDSVTDYAIIMLDPTGRIASWNQGAERLKGYRANEIVGQHFSVFYTPEDRAAGKPQDGIKRAITKGHSEDEGWRVRKDGSRYWANAVISAVRDSKNQLRGFSKVTRDMTERKRSEEQVQELNQDLLHQTQQLTAANQELEAFSYSVSHDLRTPLRAIDGFSKEILENEIQNLTELGKKDLQRIRSATQRMAQLIDDLLSLSRVTREEIIWDTVDLGEMAQAIAAELHANDPGRLVEFRAEPNLIAHGDPRHLRIALENLIGNAWKFTLGQSRAVIEFGKTQKNGVPVFFLRDNGIGFSMAYVDKLFGVFQRLHDDKAFPGTGIGLALVQRIIRRHGGEIWAEAKENQGALFQFSLPESLIQKEVSHEL